MDGDLLLRGAIRLGTVTTIAVCACLVAATSARAHVTMEPAFLADGETGLVRFPTPNERSPRATTSLAVTMPPGIAVTSVPRLPGWQSRVSGGTVTWTGGRIEGNGTVVFRAQLHASVRAGTYSMAARQGYDDGRVVRWTASFVVLPASGDAAPDEHVGRAVIAGIVGLVVIVASLAVLRRLRRQRPTGSTGGA